MLGILIGVAAVIAMLAIGKGAEQSIQAQLSSMGSNLLIMRSGPPHHGGVSMAEGMVTRFARDDISNIKREISTINRIGGVVSGRAQTTYGGKNWNTQIMGVEPDYAAMHACEPAIGRFFTEEDLVTKARVAVIGLTIVRSLFGDENPLGEFVKFNKVNFQVVGILPEKGASGFGDQDDRALVPLTTAMDRLLGAKYLNTVEIEVTSPEDLNATQEAITELMIRTHRLPPSREDSFNIRNMAELKEALSETSRVMSWLLSSIAAVSMLVGGIGIMNIMLVSVTERTREIGTRKAVGARRRDILLQFLTEALVISVLGGILGIGLGWLISVAVSSLAGWVSIVTMFSVAIAVSFSAMIGIVFGLWPARKAAGLNPIDALRYE
jgi:macrolide transport system ATP-binding/permease protein